MSVQMTEASSLAPPYEGTREDIVRYYRSLLATPHTHPDFAALRRQGRDGLLMLGALPVTTALERRKVCLVSTHFRALPPKGRMRRL
jgi:hypothetical protein